MSQIRSNLSRRSFITSLAAGAAAGVFPLSSFAAPATLPSSPTSPAEFKARLRGPILSVPTPFTSDFKLDLTGVRRMVQQALDGGIRIFSLTAGNSQYHSLTYEEVKILTRVLTESVGTAGTTIACAGPWWAGQTEDYVRFAESVGADAVQVMLPTRTDQDGQVAYFETAARATNLGLVLAGNFTELLLNRILEIDSIVAMKEDYTLNYYINMQRKYGDRLTIFAGGPKYRFLVAQPYGSLAFYSLYSTFAPQVPMRFWKAVQANDLSSAYDIVNTYEHPFFDRWSHAFWRASLAHFGVAQRYLRPPTKSFTDEQMTNVATFFDQLGLKPPTAR